MTTQGSMSVLLAVVGLVASQAAGAAVYSGTDLGGGPVRGATFEPSYGHLQWLIASEGAEYRMEVTEGTFDMVL